MILKDLRALVRRDLDDTVAPYRWSNDVIDDALNEGEEEACRRGRLLLDSTTEEVCQIETVAEEVVYPLDPRIIFVRRVKSSRFSTPLTKIRQRDLDASYPGWQDKTGEVTHYCLDHTAGSLVTYKEPTALLVPELTLTVVRLPLKPMDADDDEPEINRRHHRDLRHWAVYRCFETPDEELNNPEKSAAGLAMFERTFGKQSTAVDEQWINANHGYDDDEGLF